jgi:uncharacterized damage-inducible protein DinB
MKWFDRKFEFNFTADYFPNILERLTGTAARLDEKLKGIQEEALRTKIDDSWSIKDHIGHLTDLEPLWITRVKQILNGDTDLLPADLQNSKTNEAGHNRQELLKLLSDFRLNRDRFLELLNSVPQDKLEHFGLHPRLQTPMRIIDVAYFVAEHDDHHLVKITEILNQLK